MKVTNVELDASLVLYKLPTRVASNCKVWQVETPPRRAPTSSRPTQRALAYGKPNHPTTLNA